MTDNKPTKTLLMRAAQLGVKIPEGTSLMEASAMVDDVIVDQKLRLAGHTRDDPSSVPTKKSVKKDGA